MKTVTIIYWDGYGKEFQKLFTGTQNEIDAEVERLRSQPGVKWAEVSNVSA